MTKWLRERWFLQRLFLSGLACGMVVVFAFSGLMEGSQAESPSGQLPGQLNPTQPTGPIRAPTLPEVKKGEPLPANLFVELSKLLDAATVNIFTTMNVGPRGYGGRRLPRDPFFDMFEEFMNPGGPMPQRQAQALGTGFIISSDGLIITNNHVVEGASQVKVMVQTGDKSEKSYEATIVGTDKRTDLALIKIEPKQTLTVAQLGSSKDLEVGEWVAAFGNPLGLGHTMTKGIISAKNRAIDELNRFPFLQTDASINPGNSGGPLVNTRGLVVGVNTAIAASGQGIGFAIPIDDAKPIIAQLQKHGSIQHGFMGVGLSDLTPQAAEYFGLTSLDGSLINQVLPNGPAAKAGIHQYDIVTKFGDKKITNSMELSNAVNDSAVGSKVKVTVTRGGRDRTVVVTVGENPNDAIKQARREPHKQYQGQKAPLNLGFKMTEINDQARQEFDLPTDVGQRSVVIEVEPGSLAARAGLRAGDVILDVNQQETRSSADVIRRLRPGQNSLRVARSRGVAMIFLSTATEGRSEE